MFPPPEVDWNPVELGDNGGFPVPVAGEAVRLVRCEHEACGAATCVRLPLQLPAKAVRRVVEALPAAQREVVTLRHGAGLTFREIAERLGRPLGTVLTQMRAALEKIGVALEAYR